MNLIGVLAFATLVLVDLCGCACRPPVTGALEKPAVAAATHLGGEGTVLKYLTAALGPRQGVFRLYYHGLYEATGSDFHLPGVGFPPVPVRPPPKGASGITAVRAIFRGDRNVVVMQGRRGMIRIYIGRVSQAILRTTLRRVKFTPDDQYTPTLAIDAITGSKDVIAAAKRFSFGSDQYILDVLVSGPAGGGPHLPPVLRNVSVDRAFDMVAKDFRVALLCGEYTEPGGKHLFDVRYDAIVQPR